MESQKMEYGVLIQDVTDYGVEVWDGGGGPYTDLGEAFEAFLTVASLFLSNGWSVAAFHPKLPPSPSEVERPTVIASVDLTKKGRIRIVSLYAGPPYSFEEEAEWELGWGEGEELREKLEWEEEEEEWEEEEWEEEEWEEEGETQRRELSPSPGVVSPSQASRGKGENKR